MIIFIDAFGRETHIDITNQSWSRKIHFIIKKERQSVAEAIDIETAESIVRDMQLAIDVAKLKKDGK